MGMVEAYPQQLAVGCAACVHCTHPCCYRQEEEGQLEGEEQLEREGQLKGKGQLEHVCPTWNTVTPPHLRSDDYAKISCALHELYD